MTTRPLRRPALGRSLAAALLAVAGLTLAAAQTPIVPTSAADIYAPIGGTATSALQTPAAAPAHPALFRWGPFGLRPLLTYRFMSAHGLQQTRGHPLDTSVHSMTAGVVGDIGQHWTVEYVPTWSVYSNAAFRDVVEQHVAVNGTIMRPSWTAEFAQEYGNLDAPVVETAEQTAEQTSMTRGSIHWLLPKNVSFSAVATQNLTFIEKLPDHAEWSFAPELDYQLFPSVLIGAGYTVGYVMVYHTADSFYQRPLGHVHWQLTRKTSLDASVGSDHWEFLGRQHGSLSSLYYSVDLNWSPVEPTVVRLTTLRSDSVAMFRAQLSRAEGWGVTLEQRLLGHLHLSLGTSRQTTRYLVDATSSGQVRRDELETYQTALRTEFLRRGNIEVFYHATRNRSNLEGYSFSSHQIGFEIGFRY